MGISIKERSFPFASLRVRMTVNGLRMTENLVVILRSMATKNLNDDEILRSSYGLPQDDRLIILVILRNKVSLP